MKQFIQQHGTLFVAYSLALLFLVLSLDRCRCRKEVKQTESHTLTHKKSILEKEVKVLHDTRTIQVVKWRTQIVKGDSVFRYVYLLASDSCKLLLDSLNKQRLIEQNTASDVIQTDSLTIAALDSLNKVNDALIGKYKGQISLLGDSIKKVRRRSYWKGLKHGFVIGAGAVEVINILNK